MALPQHSPSSTRLFSIDALRGLVIIFMLLDHVRETFYLHMQVSDPMDVTTTSPMLLITRLLTHVCAPTFIFLTGLSAYLYGQKYGGHRREISTFLLKRGLFLVLLEVTLVNFGWTFQLPPQVIYLQVIWAIGLSMMALSGLIWLPKPALLILSILIIAGHNLLDTVHFDVDAMMHAPWAILHNRGWLTLGEHLQFRTSYPLLPWIGVISLGFYFGPLFNQNSVANQREKVLFISSSLMLLAFIVIRAINVYGDKRPRIVTENTLHNIMSFLNVTKYPPSLQFLLLTLSVCLLLLALLEKANHHRWIQYLSIFGAVPMFFYLIHIYLLKILYLATVAIWGVNKGNYFGVDAVWQLVLCAMAMILALYPLMKWFAGVKTRRRDLTWLKYF